MNVKITYTNGASSIVPVSDSATVKFTWHTVSKDGYQRSDNEQAFALADVTALEVVEDAPALAADVHAAADPASEAAPVVPAIAAVPAAEPQPDGDTGDAVPTPDTTPDAAAA